MWQQNPMMFNNGFNAQNYNAYNPMAQQMQQMQQNTQTIQQLNQQTQKQASCYFVKAPQELASVNVEPNVYYLGINRDNSEIYIRRMNNDGNIEAETYVKASEQKEKSEMQKILERLDVIEKKLTNIGVKDVSVVNVANE